jgi:hypothetical protein
MLPVLGGSTARGDTIGIILLAANNAASYHFTQIEDFPVHRSVFPLGAVEGPEKSHPARWLFSFG